MKKIIIPVLVCFSTLLISVSANAQKTEDTTKTVTPGGKKMKVNKKINPKMDRDTTMQQKITVNDDGVTGKKRTKKMKTTNGNNSTEKKEEGVVEPKKED